MQRLASHDGRSERTGELPLLRRIALVVLLGAFAAAGLSWRAQHNIIARDATIGATLAPAGNARHAAMLVTSLRAGGPAERAGLHVGDRLDRIDGQPARSLAELERAMASRDPMMLRVHRGADAVTLSIAGGKRVAHVDTDPAGRR